MLRCKRCSHPNNSCSTWEPRLLLSAVRLRSLRTPPEPKSSDWTLACVGDVEVHISWTQRPGRRTAGEGEPFLAPAWVGAPRARCWADQRALATANRTPVARPAPHAPRCVLFLVTVVVIVVQLSVACTATASVYIPQAETRRGGVAGGQEENACTNAHWMFTAAWLQACSTGV